MELDTGPLVFIISERHYNALFKEIKIKNDELKLQYLLKKP